MRAHEIRTGRQLLEGELAGLVGDGKGGGPPERRDDDAVERLAGFVEHRADDLRL